METKRYDHAHIELCRRCAGSGVIWKYDALDILQRNEPTPGQCTLCAGSGRVFVSKVTTISIEPYTEKK